MLMLISIYGKCFTHITDSMKSLYNKKYINIDDANGSFNL